LVESIYSNGTLCSIGRPAVRPATPHLCRGSCWPPSRGPGRSPRGRRETEPPCGTAGGKQRQSQQEEQRRVSACTSWTACLRIDALGIPSWRGPRGRPARIRQKPPPGRAQPSFPHLGSPK
jgi:hypothetical protein